MISDIVASKTANQVESFYLSVRRRYRLDEIRTGNDADNLDSMKVRLEPWFCTQRVFFPVSRFSPVSTHTKSLIEDSVPFEASKKNDYFLVVVLRHVLSISLFSFFQKQRNSFEKLK